MATDHQVNKPPSHRQHAGRRLANQCHSCGAAILAPKQRYCSVGCRQRLHYQLDLRTGLLKTMRARYATFYFTDAVIVLDVLPYGAADIYSFIYPRSNRNKPAEDFSRLANVLGNAWWKEKKRTNKDYLADRLLFESATKASRSDRTVKPTRIKIPSIRGTALIQLKLNKQDLASPQSEKIIKQAYRRQAKQHHPDLGGNTRVFRKIYQAYEELLNWSANPTFVVRSGFPDKWFYRGDQNRWVQPMPRKQ